MFRPVKFLAIFVTLILSILAQYPVENCHERGKWNGIFSLGDRANSYNQCRQRCIDNFECNCFTYFEDQANCVEFSSCTDIDKSCTNCYSGLLECAEDLECNRQGECKGNFVNTNITATVDGCIELCANDPECQWYTYSPLIYDCFLLSECINFDETNINYVSGQKNCSRNLQDLLMVVGGDTSAAYYDVEVLDLTGKDRECEKPRDYTRYMAPVGTFIDREVLVCGGQTSSSYYNQCYVYIPANDTWINTKNMVSSRAFAAGVMISDTEWWVTGGRTTSILSTTELLNNTGDFNTYTALPTSRSGHSAVKINNTHVAILGHYASNRNQYIHDRIAGSWTNYPSLVNRAGAQGGLVIYPNLTQVLVIAGGNGLNSSEIFSLERKTWQPGPDLPVDMVYNGQSVQYRDSFLIVGGRNSSYSKSIIRFDAIKEDWVILEQELATARDQFAAFTIPDYYISCT